MRIKPIAERAARPQPIHKHVLVHTQFIKQHFMGDNRWVAEDLEDEYDAMINMLSKRSKCMKHDNREYRKHLEERNRTLKRETSYGRKKLNIFQFGKECQKELRNYLMNHKDYQRLYSKIPLRLAVENINDHTFGLRKERDRLRYRMEQLKENLKIKLIELSELENRHVYKNNFVLEEEIKWHECLKKLNNANIRLRGIKAINVVYKKMMQVLCQDVMFYEPILSCLEKDIEDQSIFVNYVLYVGTPAIARFKKLSEDFREREDKGHKEMINMRQSMTGKTVFLMDRKRFTHKYMRNALPRTRAMFQRFLRETPSMQALKEELNSVEETMKQLQNQVLCSNAENIFNRMKTKFTIKRDLEKEVVNGIIGTQCSQSKMNRAKALKGVLINNLYTDEIRRLRRIEILKRAIKEQDHIEGRIKGYLKDRANVYVLLRFSLWRMSEIVRGVGPFIVRPTQLEYPTEDLMLPLLKFERLHSHAYPPQGFEENVHTIMNSLKEKVQLLNNALIDLKSRSRNKPQFKSFEDEYCQMFMNSSDYGMLSEERRIYIDDSLEENLQSDLKTSGHVPTRTEMKVQSYKLLDAMQKKDT